MTDNDPKTAPDGRLLDTVGFWDWFASRKGGVSTRAVEEYANVPRGRISNPAAGRFAPTTLICQAVSDGLNVPLQEVLIAAQGERGQADNPEVQAMAEMVREPGPVTPNEQIMLYYFRRLPRTRQEILLEILKPWAATYLEPDNDGG